MARDEGSHWFRCFLPHGIAGGATSVLIPLFAYALGGSLVDVGIIAAATSIASVPAFILWGALSDRLHRRRAFLVLGFAGSTLSFAAMAASGTMAQFYLANLLFGFLAAAAAPVSVVLVMETSERKQWPARVARLSRIGGVGWVVGLAAGAAWLGVSTAALGELMAMRILFLAGAGLGLLAAAFATAWVREPTKRVPRRAVRLVDIYPRIERGRYLPMRLLHFLRTQNHRRKAARLSRPLKVYLAAAFLLFSGFTAFYGFFPIFLREAYGLSNPEVFAVFIASQVASAASYVRAARWIGNRGGRVMQIRGSIARAALFPAFFVVGLAPLTREGLFLAAVALHAGVGFTWAIVHVAGTTLVSRLAHEDGRAEALGSYNAIQGFGAILGPLLGGVVAGLVGYEAAFAVSAGLVFAGVIVLAVERVPEA